MKFFFVIGILIACLFISDAKPVLEEELVDSSNQVGALIIEHY